MTHVVSRRDPRWEDDLWRTETFLALIADYKLTVEELADYFERSTVIIWQWRSGKSRAIPKSQLRLLMLELAVGGRYAVQ